MSSENEIRRLGLVDQCQFLQDKSLMISYPILIREAAGGVMASPEYITPVDSRTVDPVLRSIMVITCTSMFDY